MVMTATGPSRSIRTFIPGMIELLGVPGWWCRCRKYEPGAIRLTRWAMSCYRARMMMTRPACARVRQLVAGWLGWVLWCSAGGACAQVRAELERALTVTRELPGCVGASALRARTAQYLGRA